MDSCFYALRGANFEVLLVILYKQGLFVFAPQVGEVLLLILRNQ